MNIFWQLWSTNLKIYFSLLWFQRRDKSIGPKASNMAEEYPGDGRVEMTKSKPRICLLADIQSLTYNMCPLYPDLLELLFCARNAPCQLMG